MPRSVRLFFGFLACSLAAFSAAALLTFGRHSDLGWQVSLVRFMILLGAIGSAFAAWGTAVSIAYVHRVTWPFLLMTALVTTAGIAFGVVCYRLS
jgi:fatty acid desaturase